MYRFFLMIKIKVKKGFLGQTNNYLSECNSLKVNNKTGNSSSQPF